MNVGHLCDLHFKNNKNKKYCKTNEQRNKQKPVLQKEDFKIQIIFAICFLIIMVQRL